MFHSITFHYYRLSFMSTVRSADIKLNNFCLYLLLTIVKLYIYVINFKYLFNWLKFQEFIKGNVTYTFFSNTRNKVTERKP